MNPHLAQANFLTSYSFYKHSLILPDSDRMAWARQDAADQCKIFFDLCENDPRFATSLKIAYDFSARGYHADAPESNPFLIITEDKPKALKPEQQEEKLPWEKKKPTVNTSDLSKQQVLEAVSTATGIKAYGKLIAGLNHARLSCRKNGSKYIYDQTTIDNAIKFLKP